MTDSDHLPLQHAVPGPLPAGEEWVYEPRWGGRRVLVEISEGTVSVVDERGRELADVASVLAESGLGTRLADVVLDGEIVTNDDSVVLVVSDVLRLYGVTVARQTWTERRGVLERMTLVGAHVQLAQVYDDGEALLSAVRELGLAGIVAKRRDAAYLSAASPTAASPTAASPTAASPGGAGPADEPDELEAPSWVAVDA